MRRPQPYSSVNSAVSRACIAARVGPSRRCRRSPRAPAPAPAPGAAAVSRAAWRSASPPDCPRRAGAPESERSCAPPTGAAPAWRSRARRSPRAPARRADRPAAARQRGQVRLGAQMAGQKAEKPREIGAVGLDRQRRRGARGRASRGRLSAPPRRSCVRTEGISPIGIRINPHCAASTQGAGAKAVSAQRVSSHWAQRPSAAATARPRNASAGCPAAGSSPARRAPASASSAGGPCAGTRTSASCRASRAASACSTRRPPSARRRSRTWAVRGAKHHVAAIEQAPDGARRQRVAAGLRASAHSALASIAQQAGQLRGNALRGIGGAHAAPAPPPAPARPSRRAARPASISSVAHAPARPAASPPCGRPAPRRAPARGGASSRYSSGCSASQAGCARRKAATSIALGRVRKRPGRGHAICCPVFAQSARKAARPLSVSGWLKSERSTVGGSVATWAPSLAAVDHVDRVRGRRRPAPRS